MRTVSDAPLTRALPGFATSAHQLFELLAGSGVIGQARVGLPAAAGASALLDAAWIAAAMDRERWDRTLAAGAGMAVVAPVLHYTLFPSTLRRGLPTLLEAEGLDGPALAAYNGLLYVWAVAGLVGLSRVPVGVRRWALLGVVLATAFRHVAEEHLEWIQQEARRNPRWWNRSWWKR